MMCQINHAVDTSETISSILHEILEQSKKTILLIVIVISATLLLSGLISIWLYKTVNLYIPSFSTIKTLGVKAYWDPPQKPDNRNPMAHSISKHIKQRHAIPAKRKQHQNKARTTNSKLDFPKLKRHHRFRTSQQHKLHELNMELQQHNS
jgi:hypothetical protein